MADLSALLSAVAQAEAAQDVDGLREVRKQIVAHSPDSAAAAEALYKLGLDMLFVGRDLPGSVALLEQASRGQHAFWVACARTSLALCYLQQKRQQKALFELRRVAYPKVPSGHSVTALLFMETIFAQEHKSREADQVRADRQKQLQELLDGKGEAALSAQERGHYLHQLSVTYGSGKERPKAKAALAEAMALGPQAVGAELWQTLQHAASQDALAPS